MFDLALVGETHRAIDARLAVGGARVDAYYYCPHHPDGRVAAYARSCDCRKPGRGMIDQATADLGLDPVQSYVVGDKWSDVELGRVVGARTILVRTGTGAEQEQRPLDGLSADAVVDNLAAAVSWILLNPQSAIHNPQC
jgi:D-glycero-D-manno-heptose 1,7-bisphosphate phosphatase